MRNRVHTFTTQKKAVRASEKFDTLTVVTGKKLPMVNERKQSNASCGIGHESPVARSGSSKTTRLKVLTRLPFDKDLNGTPD